MQVKLVLVNQSNKILIEIPQEMLIEALGEESRGVIEGLVNFLRRKSGEL